MSQNCTHFSSAFAYDPNYGQFGEHINTAELPRSKEDGVCGTSENTCISGDYYSAPDTSTEYRWFCAGINGGRDSGMCSAIKPIDGKCGAAARNYPATDIAFSGAKCDIGTVNPVSPIFPAKGSTVSWQCLAGNSAGNPVPCNARHYGECTGNVPANAVMYPGDEPANMLTSVARTYRSVNSPAYCEYSCSDPAFPDWDAANNKCTNMRLQVC